MSILKESYIHLADFSKSLLHYRNGEVVLVKTDKYEPDSPETLLYYCGENSKEFTSLVTGESVPKTKAEILGVLNYEDSITYLTNPMESATVNNIVKLGETLGLTREELLDNPDGDTLVIKSLNKYTNDEVLNRYQVNLVRNIHDRYLDLPKSDLAFIIDSIWKQVRAQGEEYNLDVYTAYLFFYMETMRFREDLKDYRVNSIMASNNLSRYTITYSDILVMKFTVDMGLVHNDNEVLEKMGIKNDTANFYDGSFIPNLSKYREELYGISNIKEDIPHNKLAHLIEMEKYIRYTQGEVNNSSLIFYNEYCKSLNIEPIFGRVFSRYIQIIEHACIQEGVSVEKLGSLIKTPIDSYMRISEELKDNSAVVKAGELLIKYIAETKDEITVYSEVGMSRLETLADSKGLILNKDNIRMVN